MIPRFGASPWSQWNLAVTGINASPENPGPGCAVARCLTEARGFRGRVLGLGYETLDGLSILREVRKTSDLPVIMVTARVEEIDHLLGLELGADDYVCKPYSPREVVARVKTVLRRSRPRDQGTPAPVQAPLVEIDAEGWQARCGGRNLSLTPKEFLLLQALVSRPGQVFSRTRLLDLMVLAADGWVSPEAETLLRDVLGREPQNIAALCDVDSRKLGSAAEKHPQAKKYHDWRKLARSDELAHIARFLIDRGGMPADG